MKIGVIGDVHGRTTWKQILSKVDEFDKIVFIGDYMDSFHISSLEQIKNLKEIVEFKKQYPEKVILLYGNHDLSYIDILMCQGYNGTVKFEAFQLLNPSNELFQLAYEVEGILFTHAGLTEKFYNFVKTLKIYKIAEGNIVDTLNYMIEKDSIYLDWHTYERGGVDNYSSIVWTGLKELFNTASNVFKYQVVGHTAVPKAYMVDSKKEGVSLLFVDDQYPLEIGFHTIVVENKEIVDWC